ncbi:MAG: hypothetical protein IPK62_00935 [Bacteroidetes bacterium]|nr:hypothetical protein [Bacteroidota bacterium]
MVPILDGLNSGNTLLSGARYHRPRWSGWGLFMDTLAHHLYGPKTAGTWRSPTALIGLTGLKE